MYEYTIIIYPPPSLYPFSADSVTSLLRADRRDSMPRPSSYNELQIITSRRTTDNQPNRTVCYNHIAIFSAILMCLISLAASFIITL